MRHDRRTARQKASALACPEAFHFQAFPYRTHGLDRHERSIVAAAGVATTPRRYERCTASRQTDRFTLMEK